MSKIKDFQLTGDVLKTVGARTTALTEGSPLYVTLRGNLLEFELTTSQRVNIVTHQDQRRPHPGRSEGGSLRGYDEIKLPSELEISDLGKPFVAINHRTGEELVGTLEFFSNNPQAISQSKFSEDWETQVYLRAVPKDFVLNNRHWTVAIYTTFSN